jgi:hypothetical protein
MKASFELFINKTQEEMGHRFSQMSRDLILLSVGLTQAELVEADFDRLNLRKLWAFP